MNPLSDSKTGKEKPRNNKKLSNFSSQNSNSLSHSGVESLKSQSNTIPVTPVVKFDCNFECGALGTVYKNSTLEYTIILSNDTNNINYRLWFYFSVECNLGHQEGIFHIQNMTKKKMSMKNYRPVFRYENDQEWKKVPKFQLHKNSTLTLHIDFKTPKQKVYIAFSYPYTYTRHRSLMNFISENYDTNVKKYTLSESHQKKEVDILMISSSQNLAKMDSRVHSIIKKLRRNKSRVDVASFPSKDLSPTTACSLHSSMTPSSFTVSSRDSAVDSAIRLRGAANGNPGHPPSQVPLSSSFSSLHALSETPASRTPEAASTASALMQRKCLPHDEFHFRCKEEFLSSTRRPHLLVDFLASRMEHRKSLGSNKRPSIIFLSARIHPGETLSSYVMETFLQTLLNKSFPTKKLLQHFVFLVVPLLNPDGVIMGNYRCDSLGMDMNRQFMSGPGSLDILPLLTTKEKKCQEELLEDSASSDEVMEEPVRERPKRKENGETQLLWKEQCSPYPVQMERSKERPTLYQGRILPRRINEPTLTDSSFSIVTQPSVTTSDYDPCIVEKRKRQFGISSLEEERRLYRRDIEPMRSSVSIGSAATCMSSATVSKEESQRSEDKVISNSSGEKKNLKEVVSEWMEKRPRGQELMYGNFQLAPITSAMTEFISALAAMEGTNVKMLIDIHSHTSTTSNFMYANDITHTTFSKLFLESEASTEIKESNRQRVDVSLGKNDEHNEITLHSSEDERENEKGCIESLEGHSNATEPVMRDFREEKEMQEYMSQWNDNERALVSSYSLIDSNFSSDNSVFATTTGKKCSSRVAMFLSYPFIKCYTLETAFHQIEKRVDASCLKKKKKKKIPLAEMHLADYGGLGKNLFCAIVTSALGLMEDVKDWLLLDEGKVTLPRILLEKELLESKKRIQQSDKGKSSYQGEKMKKKLGAVVTAVVSSKKKTPGNPLKKRASSHGKASVPGRKYPNALPPVEMGKAPIGGSTGQKNSKLLPIVPVNALYS